MSSKRLKPLAAHIPDGFAIRVSKFYPAGGIAKVKGGKLHAQFPGYKPFL
jgi:hypothetical protein